MAEPLLRREGNLRFAGLACPGYPEDPWAICAEVRRLLAGEKVDFIGPPTLLFSLPPQGAAADWECQVGLALSGLPAPRGTLAIEDYSQLSALSLPHPGPIADLAATHRRLADHGRSLGHQVRPYWRLALRRRRLADGNGLPVSEVAVFLDRW